MTKTVLVFRVENENKQGPYCTGLSNPLRDHPHRIDIHPTPEEDGMGFVPFGVYRFGFQSFEKFREWFFHPMGRNSLNKSGFHLSVYRVPQKHVKYGNKQCGFIPKDAILIDIIPINTPFRR